MGYWLTICGFTKCAVLSVTMCMLLIYSTLIINGYSGWPPSHKLEGLAGMARCQAVNHLLGLVAGSDAP